MSATKRYTKETVGRHSRRVRVNNPIKKFSDAYQYIANNQHNFYSSIHGKIFRAKANTAKRGMHKGKKVIRFRTAKTETLAFKCCWNLQSNCYGTHINMYTLVIGLPTRMNIRTKPIINIRTKTKMKKIK